MKRLALLLVAALAACGSPSQSGALPAGSAFSAKANTPTSSRIKHVVVIIQENRSFDNMFNGFPNADTQSYGYANENGKEVKVSLKSRSFTKGDLGDLPHGYAANIVDYDGGKMDGFYESMQKWPRPGEPYTYPYAYLDRTDVAPYWTMAQQYVLADKMFATEWGASFTAHIDLIAANTWLNNQKTLALVDTPSVSPWGCDSPPKTTTPTLDNKSHRNVNGPFPCFTRYATLAKPLDNKHIAWRYYAPPLNSKGDIYSTFDAIKWVRYGKDWNNVISPQTKILLDAPKQLAPVTWIVPTGKDSDHPGQKSDTGPSWVADIVNAIGQSPNWKEHGDHRAVGRLGRLLRSRSAAATRLFGPELPRADDRHLTVRQEELRVARAIRVWQRREVYRERVHIAITRVHGRAGERTFRRVRFLAEAASVPEDTVQISAIALHPRSGA